MGLREIVALPLIALAVSGCKNDPNKKIPAKLEPAAVVKNHDIAEEKIPTIVIKIPEPRVYDKHGLKTYEKIAPNIHLYDSAKKGFLSQADAEKYLKEVIWEGKTDINKEDVDNADKFIRVLTDASVHEVFERIDGMSGISLFWSHEMSYTLKSLNSAVDKYRR